MAFDERLADRVRRQLAKRRGISEKKMFGGIAFLLHGNMCCGVHQGELIVRLNPADTDDALSKPHTRVFDLSAGRPMKGWLLVDSRGVESPQALAIWIAIGVDYAASLPKKK